ncbi:glycosyl transferase [bacterium]|nr:glycosyl transferase [bacterium]
MIEKHIFQSWHTNKLDPTIQARIDKFKKENPTYTYKLYLDADIDRFVNETYPGEIAEAYNRLNTIVAKVDFWRYLILYTYGGVYVDIDSNIEKPLDTLIREEDQAIITSENRPGAPIAYVQWALIFQKGHPILKKTVDMIVDNIKNNRYPNNILKMTGPIVFAEAIQAVHKTLFQEEVPPKDPMLDRTYKKDGISYRFFGIDYNGYLSFKNLEEHSLLHPTGKTHWHTNTKPLLKGGRRKRNRKTKRRRRLFTPATRRRTRVAHL